jgi:NTP pyrophosphatase (non-canonical NTP hydrolase)
MTGEELTRRGKIMFALHEERLRQDERWGKDRWDNMGHWQALAILTEELGEVAQALNDAEGPHPLQNPITQLAACCVAWLEALD